jgi:hypothetical protein
MTLVPAPDHKRASLAIYFVVALNTTNESKSITINKSTAARILANLLEVDLSVPFSWLRGDFKKHPLSRENFLRFVRAYGSKPGLETPREIQVLAQYLYGADYKRAMQLLDIGDRVVELQYENPAAQEQANVEIYNLLASNAEAIEIALGAMGVYHWAEAELLRRLAAIPAEVGEELARMLRLTFSQFSEGMNDAFVRLGGMPQLSLYNLDSLEALWEKNGDDLAELISLFEGLKILQRVRGNEWRISAGVLEFARQRLEELPAKTQRHAGDWWRRLLKQSKHLSGFCAHLLSKGGNLIQEVEQRDDGPPPLFVSLGNWIDTEWDTMQAFTRYMSSENFVLAQFLLMRRKRNLFLGLLLSFWLGLSPLLSPAPLWMSASIGAGVFALFRLTMDVVRCHAAWEGLWDEIIIRAKPPSPVYTCPHGHTQWRGGTHHLLQP